MRTSGYFVVLAGLTAQARGQAVTCLWEDGCAGAEMESFPDSSNASLAAVRIEDEARRLGLWQSFESFSAFARRVGQQALDAFEADYKSISCFSRASASFDHFSTRVEMRLHR